MIRRMEWEINLQLRSCGPLLIVLEGYVIRQGYAWWVKDDAPGRFISFDITAKALLPASYPFATTV